MGMSMTKVFIYQTRTDYGVIARRARADGNSHALLPIRGS